MIVAGESSGELYGSLLTKALKNKWPDVHVIGVGGERMREAGVDLVSQITDAFGLIEVVSAFGKIKAAFNSTLEAMKKFRPLVLVLIDYPGFNLKVAETAKALGIKILYYVSPQIWAWRKGRVKRIAGLVDRMAVVLPFEEELYRQTGLTCEFVGHPVLEEIEDVLETEIKSLSFPAPPLAKGGIGRGVALASELRTSLKTSLGLDPDKPLLSLLPGSRPSELNRHLPLLLNVISQFKGDPEIPLDYQFCIPLAQNTDEKKYAHHLEALKQRGAVIRKGITVTVLAASDLAIVTSGTATLQTAFLEVPMVVVYKLSPLTYQLGKRVVQVRHISLVNILSGREIVTELLQKMANSEEIIKQLKRIIFDEGYRENMLKAYRQIKEPFSDKRASDRVAEMVIEMAGR